MGVASGLLKAFAPRGSGRDKPSEKAFLHATARACGWRLGQMEESRAIRSCGWVKTSWREAATAILLHQEGRAAAFCSGVAAEETWDLRFLDCQDFVEAARALQWPVQFLTAAELAHELTAEDRAFLSSLDGAMAYDIRVWNPDTVGHVLFNIWD